MYTHHRDTITFYPSNSSITVKYTIIILYRGLFIDPQPLTLHHLFMHTRSEYVLYMLVVPSCTVEKSPLFLVLFIAGLPYNHPHPSDLVASNLLIKTLVARRQEMLLWRVGRYNFITRVFYILLFIMISFLSQVASYMYNVCVL